MRNLTLALITSTMLGVSAQSAMAVEPQEFMERFAQLSLNSGSKITFGAIEGDATSFTVKGVQMDAKGPTLKDGIPLGNITVKNIDEGENGLYTAAQIIADDINTKQKDIEFLANGMSLSGIELPAPSETALIFYENLTVENVTISTEGAALFKMQDLVLSNTGNADRTEISIDMSTKSMMLNLGDIVDSGAKNILSEMGYTTLNGTTGLKGNWNANTGLMNINDYYIDVDDAGRLSMDIAISGYTIDVAKSIGEISNIDDKNASGMAMMGLMQQLNYLGASIKFEDNSLTNKLLDFQAAKQGTDRKSLIGMAKAVLPFTMAQLNKPEFTQQLTEVVGTFLENPKSIEIIAKPAEPLTFLELVTAGSAQPQNLIDVLELQAKAN